MLSGKIWCGLLKATQRLAQLRMLVAGSLTSQSGTHSELGSDLSGLDLTVTNVSPTILRVTIGKAGRYTIPQDKVFKNVDIQSECSCAQTQLMPHSLCTGP